MLFSLLYSKAFEILVKSDDLAPDNQIWIIPNCNVCIKIYHDSAYAYCQHFVYKELTATLTVRFQVRKKGCVSINMN